MSAADQADQRGRLQHVWNVSVYLSGVRTAPPSPSVTGIALSRLFHTDANNSCCNRFDPTDVGLRLAFLRNVGLIIWTLLSVDSITFTGFYFQLRLSYDNWVTLIYLFTYLLTYLRVVHIDLKSNDISIALLHVHGVKLIGLPLIDIEIARLCWRLKYHAPRYRRSHKIFFSETKYILTALETYHSAALNNSP